VIADEESGGMGPHTDRQATQGGRRPWSEYVLRVLIAEKVIQHAVVTLAFATDLQGIRSTVVVNPDVLMVSGALVGVLFAVSLWGRLTGRKWALDLVTGLAVFDLVGEFAAQGRVFIIVTVSFVVAAILLVLGFRLRRQEQRGIVP